MQMDHRTSAVSGKIIEASHCSHDIWGRQNEIDCFKIATDPFSHGNCYGARRSHGASLLKLRIIRRLSISELLR